MIRARQSGFVLLVVVPAVAIFRLPPIPQDASYPAFADDRALPGIPNALAVISAAAFLPVAAGGVLFLCTLHGRRPR